MRQADTVARLGGDEFVVLVDGLSRHSLIDRDDKQLATRAAAGFRKASRTASAGAPLAVTNITLRREAESTKSSISSF